MRFFTVLTLTLLTLSLSACGSAYWPRRPVVEVVHRTYLVPYKTAGMSLAPDEQRRLEDFFRDVPRSPTTHIHLLAHSNDQVSMSLAAQAREWLLNHGFSTADADIAPLQQDAPEAFIVLVDFAVASVAGCPDWSDGSGHNWDNAVWANYGCASTSNLAQEVADPNDLARGHGTTATDGDRSQVAITNYKTDKVTQTVKESASSSSGQ